MTEHEEVGKHSRAAKFGRWHLAELIEADVMSGGEISVASQGQTGRAGCS